MKTNNKLIAGILIVVIVLLAYFAFFRSTATVDAIGIGEIEAEPDELSVYVMIDVKNQTAEQVKDQLGEVSDELVVSLLKIGIEKKQIQLASYNIYQDYVWDGRTSKAQGFRGNQQVVIKLNKEQFDLVFETIDAVVDSGALLNSLSYELSEEAQKQYKAEALTEAGQDAKMKAEATAEGVGKSLGKIISLETDEYSYNPRPYYDYGFAAGSEKAVDSIAISESAEQAKSAAQLNINPQELTITARVFVTYKLSRF